MKILKILEDQLKDIDPSDPCWSTKQLHVLGQRDMIAKIKGMMQYE